MIYLDAATVYANARQAYAEGRLQAQTCTDENPTYKGPCAIGVSLDEETREKFDSFETGNYSVRSLYRECALESDSIRALEKLQEAHDKVLMGQAPMKNLEEQLNRW